MNLKEFIDSASVPVPLDRTEGTDQLYCPPGVLPTIMEMMGKRGESEWKKFYPFWRTPFWSTGKGERIRYPRITEYELSLCHGRACPCSPYFKGMHEYGGVRVLTFPFDYERRYEPMMAIPPLIAEYDVMDANVVVMFVPPKWREPEQGWLPLRNTPGIPYAGAWDGFHSFSRSICSGNYCFGCETKGEAKRVWLWTRVYSSRYKDPQYLAIPGWQATTPVTIRTWHENGTTSTAFQPGEPWVTLQVARARGVPFERLLYLPEETKEGQEESPSGMVDTLCRW